MRSTADAPLFSIRLNKRTKFKGREQIEVAALSADTLLEIAQLGSTLACTFTLIAHADWVNMQHNTQPKMNRIIFSIKTTSQGN